jgi:murein DD-endopeptidase MepM/ murein hydrolase activator NlpD
VALSFAAALLIGSSIPANLIPSASAASSATTATAATPTTHHASATIQGQTLRPVSGKLAPVARDSFEAMSLHQVQAVQAVSSAYGYTVDNSGTIRWPFPNAVPIGDLFGPRVAPCAGCSTFHHGTDFQPGDGAPIYAVADGIVTVSEFSGALGQHVAITHLINGKAFTSVYGHMAAGSSPLRVGQKIKKGAIVGAVGSTGESTGPHLFFEIDIDGTAIDSFVWLKANTQH